MGTLPIRFPSMTIRATYLAFVDLSFQSFQRNWSPLQGHHMAFFFAAYMVEVQYHPVILTTIHTRVCSKVITSIRNIPFTRLVVMYTSTSFVHLFVSVIMCPRVRLPPLMDCIRQMFLHPTSVSASRRATHSRVPRLSPSLNRLWLLPPIGHGAGHFAVPGTPASPSRLLSSTVLGTFQMSRNLSGKFLSDLGTLPLLLRGREADFLRLHVKHG